MPRYDCVIIGAGHNGLVAAAYLGRAGKSVCVLERRPILGGCTSTEELYPGFRLNPAAYVISLFAPKIIEELRLREHGLVILPRDPSSFTPLLDGRWLLMGHDEAATLREIAKFSRRDAENYPKYDAMLARIAAALEPLMLSPAPRMPPRLARDFGKWWLYRRALKQLGHQWRTAFELFTAPATRILDRYFESEPLRATIATDAIIGAMAAPSTPGSAYVLLHHVMGQTGGKRGIWAYVRGGIGGLADALERACLAAGVQIRRNAEVVRINVRGTQVVGVTMADGTEIAAPTVASSIDANQTFLRLLGPEHLPDEFAEQVRHIDYSSASAKINLALDGLPEFNTGQTPREIALRGTTHIAPDLEYIERAFDDAKYGRPSQSPVLELTMASLVDETLAPPGKHVASIFVQYAPYKLAEGTWDERREAFADRCIDILAQYAPNIKRLILYRHVATPVDMERTYGLTGGNIMQGAMNLDQLGPMRLDYRTPVRGLYLCGAATHPGGGIMGICGRNAARAIL
ncbi:MAG: phytoene desaturase family protein, partial [Thermoguttaceae bacterium]